MKQSLQTAGGLGHSKGAVSSTPGGQRIRSFLDRPGKTEKKPLGLLPRLSIPSLFESRGSWLGNYFPGKFFLLPAPSTVTASSGWEPKSKESNRCSPWHLLASQGLSVLHNQLLFSITPCSPGFALPCFWRLCPFSHVVSWASTFRPTLQL